ncbi:response regulator [Nodularia spumigena CS-584]|jgi:two-component system, chemotaxis family, response regulator PixG|uniref:Protein PatA n=1 Tax=Nodularia spumigena UHCC 0060 TaxID=3110300 RepID=A0ABU5UWP8_NODSP|nr:response regulator [Nodularia spumigena]AHJ29507.1 two-component response regulator [Nodularia spumigena CCY9414]EAW45730.1 Response regulator receiver domain protein (CheY) [Nodularia spumigena CCY9414]MDB9382181.1 response regulator [Nodularia spumigena CS-584]MEA5525486.1 response regulator [Nodularia spumigena UHCC 0143]MEA5556795.1 response regulator [Nodularia spumigena CH309]
MTHPEVMKSNNILHEFKTCTELQYNGYLNIKSPKGNQWTFYYRLGRIVWATGGTHPFRRWRRNMAQYCPHIDVEQLNLRKEDIEINYWDYRILEILYKRQKIEREQIHSFVESTIAELLFDLAQQTNFVSATCERSQEVILETPMSFTSANVSMKQMQDAWKTWSEAGLTNFSPDLAPILRKPEQLQQQVSPSVYKNFVNLINGKYTLRDLAAKMKQSLVAVTRSLLSYILKGIIELVEVPDLPFSFTAVKNNSNARKPTQSNAPLVACVDDSPQVCKILEEIIISHGLRFIKIQDAVQALPTLIQNKPDLIFLDLIMPVANGYEICTQLRRISAFTNTPVIILTGNDGLLDRVRSKVVGATDFMTKPVAADKVMSVVRKYLPVQAQRQVKRTVAKSQTESQTQSQSKSQTQPQPKSQSQSQLKVCHSSLDS